MQKKHTPTIEELMKQTEQRSIRAAVAMYTVKDLVVAGIWKPKDRIDFYLMVDECYTNLREISASEATMSQKQLLADLLRSSTFDEEERQKMYDTLISPLFSWKQFQDMKVTLEIHQIPVTDSPGNAKVSTLNKELKKQDK